MIFLLRTVIWNNCYDFLAQLHVRVIQEGLVTKVIYVGYFAELFSIQKVKKHIISFKYVFCKDVNNNREQRRYLTQSNDKSTYSNRNLKNAKWQYKNVTKNFVCTTIAVRLWLNKFTGSQLIPKLCNQKKLILKFVNNPPYKDRGPTANQRGETIKPLHKYLRL